MHQKIDPIVSVEAAPRLTVALIVDLGDLDGLDGLEDPRLNTCILRELVLNIGDAPDTRHQQLWVRLDRAAVDRNLLDAEVVEGSFVAVGLLVK